MHRIVEYATREQAQNAVNTLSNQNLMGRLVYVREVCQFHLYLSLTLITGQHFVSTYFSAQQTIRVPSSATVLTLLSQSPLHLHTSKHAFASTKDIVCASISIELLAGHKIHNKGQKY